MLGEDSKITNWLSTIWQKYNTLSVAILMIVMTTIMMLIYSPLCASGDFYVHFNRLIVLMDALKNGSFPYYMDYYIMDGYGYLIKGFYSDFILIPFAILGNITEATTAYLSILFLSTVVCGVWMYIAMKKIIQNNYIALLTSLLYTFCTYRIFDIYIRGAFGEILSFTFIPLVLWGSYEIIKGDYKKWYILTIGVSLLLYSHLISTLLTCSVVAIFYILHIKDLWNDKKRIKYLIVAMLVCIPITAYLLFPMIELMLSNKFYYQENKLVDGMIGYKLNEMISGIFNSVSLRNEGLFPKLGGILTVFVLLRIFVKNNSKAIKLADTCTILGIVLFILTFPQFPWYLPPFSLFSVIQFPWRFLEYTSLMFAISGSIYAYYLLKSRCQKIILILTICFVYILIFNSDSIHYRTFICMNNKPSLSYDTTFRGMIGGEYLPARLPSNNFEYKDPEIYNDYIHERGKVIEWEKSSNQIESFTKDKGHISFEAKIAEKDNFELPLVYYIGYKTYLNGQLIPYQQSKNGLIELSLIESGKVEIVYTGTTIQKVSYYTTMLSVFLFIIFILYAKYYQKKFD